MRAINAVEPSWSRRPARFGQSRWQTVTSVEVKAGLARRTGRWCVARWRPATRVRAPTVACAQRHQASMPQSTIVTRPPRHASIVAAGAGAGGCDVAAPASSGRMRRHGREKLRLLPATRGSGSADRSPDSPARSCDSRRPLVQAAPGRSRDSDDTPSAPSSRGRTTARASSHEARAPGHRARAGRHRASSVRWLQLNVSRAQVFPRAHRAAFGRTLEDSQDCGRDSRCIVATE